MKEKCKSCEKQHKLKTKRYQLKENKIYESSAKICDEDWTNETS